MKRPGFTLVELLVVIAIIGTLVGLLLPAVQMAREQARRNTCQTNIRNMGQALTSYMAMNRRFPPGLPYCHSNPAIVAGAQADCQGPNWLSLLLPHLEENVAWDNLMGCMAQKGTSVDLNVCQDCPKYIVETLITDVPKRTRAYAVGATVPPFMVCPSQSRLDFDSYLYDTSAQLGLGEAPYGDPPNDLKLAKGNYAANFGSMFYINNEVAVKGAFEVVPVKPPTNNNQQWRMIAGLDVGATDGQFRDGLSKTVLCAEVIGIRSEKDGRGVWTWSGMGASTFTAFLPPNYIPQSPSERDAVPLCEEDVEFYPRGDEDPRLCQDVDVNDAAESFATSRSEHNGGVNVVLGDGSVHFIVDSIDPLAWQALCTRAGRDIGEIPE